MKTCHSFSIKNEGMCFGRTTKSMTISEKHEGGDMDVSWGNQHVLTRPQFVFYFSLTWRTNTCQIKDTTVRRP